MAKVQVIFVRYKLYNNYNCIDESEVLIVADKFHHKNKKNFEIQFVCVAKNLGES